MKVLTKKSSILGYVLAGKTGVSLESDLPWNGLLKIEKS
jgi:hypothetical protein